MLDALEKSRLYSLADAVIAPETEDPYFLNMTYPSKIRTPTNIIRLIPNDACVNFQSLVAYTDPSSAEPDCFLLSSKLLKSTAAVTNHNMTTMQSAISNISLNHFCSNMLAMMRNNFVN